VIANLPVVPGRAPTLDTLFIDTADRSKATALQNVVRLLFGVAPQKVSRVSIQSRELGETQEVVISGLLYYRVSFKHPQPLLQAVSRNLYPWLSSPKQGTVESVFYSPEGEDPTSYSGSNAISASFAISGSPE
jgi:hypothetical protein